MPRIYPNYIPVNVNDPTMQCYEEGEWWRVEVPGQETRYLKKAVAQQIIMLIRQHSQLIKSELIIS